MDKYNHVSQNIQPHDHDLGHNQHLRNGVCLVDSGVFGTECKPGLRNKQKATGD